MIYLKVLLALLMTGILVLGVAWSGTQFDARSFELPDNETRDVGSVEVPSGLPLPVTCYALASFSEDMPVVETALIVGRVDLTINGITMPGRFKIYHDAGQAYYHYIQVTWFKIPVLTVNERYMDGTAILDLPGNRVEDEPTIDAAANLGLWAESIWLPSIFFIDDRVEWQGIDQYAARLIVPDAAEDEVFTVQFDPATGLISELTTQRYRDPGDTERISWTNRIKAWGEFNGVMVPVLAETQWGDQDEPWALWRVEEVLYNLDVSERMAQFGGDVDD